MTQPLSPGLPVWAQSLMRYAVVLGVAALLPIAGRMASPEKVMPGSLMVIASCITWVILAPFIRNRHLGIALLVGLLSPFLGSMVFGVLLFGATTKDGLIAGLVAGSLYGWTLCLLLWKFTLPFGVLAGGVLWAVLRGVDRWLEGRIKPGPP